MGLEPVFVDINIDTLNADINKIEELLKTDDKIKGMVAVHILGNSTDMEDLLILKERYNLVLMEDTCESLGSKYNDKYLGTFGECGTYSFYFSHHITTIEGGMVVTDDFEIYQLLKCLRAHGWSRGIDGYSNENLDNRFCFINIGYNLRPMEIQAAMGSVQLKQLSVLNENRIKNYQKVVNLINTTENDILTCFKPENNCNPVWFALPFILNQKYNKKKYLEYLENNKIDTRPIVTGNFTRQPVFKDLNLNISPENFENAEIVHNQGFFIGLSPFEMTDEKIQRLVSILLSY
jgi:CDP-6-deoxy-D-xylo-4-hexulose-3-dehydrase